jgi:phospholipase/carboxylesterase
MDNFSSDKTALTGPMLLPQNGEKPTSLVVFLHGYGSDGNDLIGLAPHFAQALPSAAFISPNAPQPCDINPMGRQWFPLQTISPSELNTGAAAAREGVNGFLTVALDHFGLTDGDLILVGFSQGTMMSLETALRREAPVAGVVGFSGALAGQERLSSEIKSKPPILLIHGEQDPVVPFEAMAKAKAALEDQSVSVETLARPGLQHGIDQEGLMAAIAFTRSKLD